MYEVTKSIDYLSFTVSLKDPIAQILPDITEIESTKEGGNAYGYNMTRRYQSGLVTMWHTNNEAMGMHCIYSGKALARLDDTPMMLLDSVINNGYKVSRIDLAITSHRTDGKEHELSPHKIAELALAGKVETKLKNGVQIGESLKVQTAYFGSLKTRKRLFRAYDKGLEQGLVSDFLVRYELETRQNATQLSKQLLKGSDIGSIVNNYIKVDNPIWTMILGSNSVKPQYDDKKPTMNETLWQWLITSAAPALGKALAQSSSKEIASNNMQIFNDAMVKSYKKNSKQT